MSEVRFTVGDADADLAERLDKEISAFNAAVTGHHDVRMLSVAVRGDDGDLRGGLYGWTWGGCGYIDLLWVRDDQRGRPGGQAAGRRRSRDPAPRLRPGRPEYPYLPGAGILRPARLRRMRPHAGLPARSRRHPPGEAVRLTLGAGNPGRLHAAMPPRRCVAGSQRVRERGADLVDQRRQADASAEQPQAPGAGVDRPGHRELAACTCGRDLPGPQGGGRVAVVGMSLVLEAVQPGRPPARGSG